MKTVKEKSESKLQKDRVTEEKKLVFKPQSLYYFESTYFYFKCLFLREIQRNE